MISSYKPRLTFFVVGVVKGGTTSLYHYLSQHPDVYLPPIKETNHFAAKDISPTHFLPGYAQDVKIDLDAYIGKGMREQVHIAHVNSTSHYNAIFAQASGEAAVGEISNSYMVCPSAAQAIHGAYPDAKILVILRNPIGRAWSQYLMNLREAKTDQPGFIDEVVRDHNAPKKGWGVNHQYLELGNYAAQLKRYVDLFGRNRVLAIFYEEYRSTPQASMKHICEFLKIDPNISFDFGVESNKASLPRNGALNKLLVKSGAVKAMKEVTPKSLRKYFAKALYSEKNLPQISAEEKKWLLDYYQQEVINLHGMLGSEVFKYWPEFKST